MCLVGCVCERLGVCRVWVVLLFFEFGCVYYVYFGGWCLVEGGGGEVCVGVDV